MGAAGREAISSIGAESACLSGVLHGLRKSKTPPSSPEPIGGPFAISINHVFGVLDERTDVTVSAVAASTGIAFLLGHPENAQSDWGDGWYLSEYSKAGWL